mgnify:CR=1 FL=1
MNLRKIFVINYSNVKNIWEYETLSETEWGDIPFSPNLYVNIEDHISKKISLMEIYNSEIFKFPHPRSKESILTLSKKRGTEVFVKNAESFFIVRGVI